MGHTRESEAGIAISQHCPQPTLFRHMRFLWSYCSCKPFVKTWLSFASKRKGNQVGLSTRLYCLPLAARYISCLRIFFTRKLQQKCLLFHGQCLWLIDDDDDDDDKLALLKPELFCQLWFFSTFSLWEIWSKARPTLLNLWMCCRVHPATLSLCPPEQLHRRHYIRLGGCNNVLKKRKNSVSHESAWFVREALWSMVFIVSFSGAWRSPPIWRGVRLLDPSPPSPSPSPSPALLRVELQQPWTSRARLIT